MTIRIELLGHPKGKGRPRFRRSTGRAYTPEETRTYEQALRSEAMLQMRGKTPLEGPVHVEVRAHLPIPSSWSKSKQSAAELGLAYPTGRPDCDNYLKLSMDACNQVVWLDDCQVIKATVSKRYSDKPKLVVEVAAI
jgi:Holliday junction resolvase RusA-like endonuclease